MSGYLEISVIPSLSPEFNDQELGRICHPSFLLRLLAIYIIGIVQISIRVRCVELSDRLEST